MNNYQTIVTNSTLHVEFDSNRIDQMIQSLYIFNQQFNTNKYRIYVTRKITYK